MNKFICKVALFSSFSLLSPALAGNLFGRARRADPATPVSGPGEGLLIQGSIHNGVGTLNPTFPVAGVSSQPEPGAFSLHFLDRKGKLLKQLDFDAQNSPDLPEGMDYRSFTFVVPFTAELKKALVSLELFQGLEKLATLRSSNGRAVAAPLRVEPVARLLRPGWVRLVWDAATHPKVMVQETATGATLALAEGGSMDLFTETRELELTLSDGLRSQSRIVEVLD